MTHRAKGAVAVSHAGHITAHAAIAAIVMPAGVRVPMMVRLRVMIASIAIVWSPTPGGVIVGMAPIRVRIPRVVPIVIPAPIGSPVGTVAPTYINARIVVPGERIVAVNIDIRVAAVVGVVIVIIVS